MHAATRLLRRRHKPTARGLRDLYSPDQIRWIIHRERSRADRSGEEFSLVVLTLESSSPRNIARLGRILLSCARIMDDVGLFEGQRLCAVLPQTPSLGGWRFAHRVCELAEQHSLKMTPVVYAYPSKWFGPRYDGDGDANGRGGLRLAAFNPAVVADRRSEPQSAESHHLRQQRQSLMPFINVGMADELGPTEVPAIPVETLLIHPLPHWKRILDVVGGSIALVLFSPVMLVACLAIKLTSRGPVIFRQKRAGLAGRPFTILKFRTMVLDAEARQAALRDKSEQDGPAFKLKSDPRVTTVGRILRMLSFDELPQLWNVIRGDMTLVGPRPLPMRESEGCSQWQRRRLDVTPGLTCIWQVRGRSSVAFDDWIRMDLQYIRDRGVYSDLKILLQTVPAVILRRGAH